MSSSILKEEIDIFIQHATEHNIKDFWRPLVNQTICNIADKTYNTCHKNIRVAVSTSISSILNNCYAHNDFF